jgi:ABC-type phosphate/phosphonate transport system substrate-binding protein
MNPTRRNLCAGGAALLHTPWLLAQAPAEPLITIGLAPFLTTAAMLSAFRPLREHLARQLQHKVELYTAKDFVDLLNQTRAGAHDLSYLPSHLAGLAINEWGFHAIAGTLSRTPVLLLVRSQGDLRSPADLRGRKIGSLGQLSLSAAVGSLWLQQNQLRPGRDVQLVPQTSINSAMISLERGDVDAVFAARSQIDLLPADNSRGHGTMAEVGSIEAPIFVAQPRLAADRVARRREAMLSFVPDPTRPGAAGNTQLYRIDAAILKRLALLREIALEQLREAGLSGSSASPR